MKRSLTFAYPGRLDLNTGGYIYDRRLIDGLRELGWRVDPLGLGDGFPFPSPDGLAEAENRLSALADGSLVLVDGLAFGVLDQWAYREKTRLKIIALVHHPLALETGLTQAQQQDLRDSERMALSTTRHVFVTSPVTARELGTHYDMAQADITIARPGTDKAAEMAAGGGRPPHILSIGTLCRRKGHDILIAALKRIEHLEWRATIIGSRDLDPQTAAALAAQIRNLGLSGRVILAGECPDTRSAIAGADIFALASRYEGYGMVFAEALSQGLPIVACRAGAVPDVVPVDAGILVPVDNVSAFSGALCHLLENPDERLERSQASARAGALLPGWQDTARLIGQSLERIA